MPETFIYQNQAANSWTEVLYRLTHPFKHLVFAGMDKNTGKTTAFNVFNSIYQASGLGITSFGYDGEPQDLVFSHPKPAIEVFSEQLVLTAENFLPAHFKAYEVLEQWGNHPQFGAWQILRIKQRGTMPIAGPSNLPELQEGLKRLQDAGAIRVHIDGALNRLSHLSLGDNGSILSTGMTAGMTINEVSARTRYQIELFRLPLLTSEEVSFFKSQGCSLNTNHFLAENKWHALPDFLWTQALEKLLPPEVEGLYLRGALTDFFVERLRRVGRLPHFLIVNTPAQVLITAPMRSKLKTEGIAIRLICKPNLILLTLNPWHPVKCYTTDLLVNELLQFCPVPIVDIKKQTIWFGKEVERSDPALS